MHIFLPPAGEPTASGRKLVQCLLSLALPNRAASRRWNSTLSECHQQLGPSQPYLTRRHPIYSPLRCRHGHPLPSAYSPSSRTPVESRKGAAHRGKVATLVKKRKGRRGGRRDGEVNAVGAEGELEPHC
jgi:hypothetical protein